MNGNNFYNINWNKLDRKYTSMNIEFEKLNILNHNATMSVLKEYINYWAHRERTVQMLINSR